MKKIIISLVVGLLAVAAVWFGRPAYKDWVARRSVAQAQEHFGRKEYREASLCARKALAVRPANVAASRLMAQLAEMAQAPEALKWRQRIVELEPAVLQHRLDLAATALSQRNPVLARETLAAVDAAGRQTLEYHQMAAMVAVMAGQLAEAEQHFIAAVGLAPDNLILQLNLAILRGQSTNAATAAAAQRQIEELAGNPTVRREALRQLALLAQQQKDWDRAQTFSRQLLAEPETGFEDRVLHLTLLEQGKSPESATFLQELQQAAAANPEQVFGLASWMIQHDQARAAVDWLQQLPESTRQQQPVIMALADGYSALEDWTRLQQLLTDQKWEALEFSRLAILAKAAAEQNQDLAARSQWKLAVREATPSLKALQTLLRMATAWKWDDDRHDLLWIIAQRFPQERWAMRELEKGHYAKGNTRELHKVYAEQVSFNLKDFAAKNNLATTSMLLKFQLTQAHELAQQVYAADPKQPAFATTYAYSLHLQGQTAAGLQAIEKLQPEEINNPAVATYYGVLLAAVGQTNKARPYLERAKQGLLLPEEKALVAAALTGQ